MAIRKRVGAVTKEDMDLRIVEKMRDAEGLVCYRLQIRLSL